MKNENGVVFRKFAAVTSYAIAMGYLESAVVIYLRQTAFGNPVQVFPIRFLAPQLGVVEFVREAATIIMLLVIGYLAGKNRFQRSMFFIYSFAIWDIFYYLFLRMFTGWPASFADFDVLFLIPVIWVSPVICPILISLLLTMTSTILILLSTKREDLRVNPVNLELLLLGSAILFYSFTEQILRVLCYHGPKGLEHFTPVVFDWSLFSIGFLILCITAMKTVKECFHKVRSDDAAERKRKAIL
jgi:hypothetical protein